MSQNKKSKVENLLRLMYWLESWRTSDGGYNGYVIHRLGSRRMFKIHDTPWSQTAMINGYLNLYKKSNISNFLQKAIQAADLQAKRMRFNGKYLYAGHEDDRFTSLVHCALADCALLNMCPHVDKARRSTYLAAVFRNFDKYLIPSLWVESRGVFRFSEIDYYSTKDRFVANMNSVALEALLKLSDYTEDYKYSHYINSLISWLLNQIIESPGIGNGGVPYQEVEGKGNAENKDVIKPPL